MFDRWNFQRGGVAAAVGMIFVALVYQGLYAGRVERPLDFLVLAMMFFVNEAGLFWLFARPDNPPK